MTQHTAESQIKSVCCDAGNSFHSYAQRWAQKAAKGTNGRPHELLAASMSGTAVELPISEADFSVSSAFNDLSLHLFPKWRISAEETNRPSTTPLQISC